MKHIQRYLRFLFAENKYTNSTIPKESVRMKEVLFGYFLDPAGATLAGGVCTSFLNYYLTSVYFAGQPASVVAEYLVFLPLVSGGLIIAGNLFAGQLIEKTETSQGKARPWILISAVLLPISCLMLFLLHPRNLAAKMLCLFLTYNLYYAVASPLYSTANHTLIPLSTHDTQRRSLLATASNTSGLAVMGFGSMVFPLLVGTVIVSQSHWAAAFAVMGVISCFACILQYKFTRERVTENRVGHTQNRIPARKQWKVAMSNRYWWIILVFHFVFQLGGSLKNLSMVYYCKHVLDSSFWGLADGSGATQTLLSVVGAVPMALAVAVVWPLSNKIGKKNITALGLLIGVLGGIIAAFGGSQILPVASGIAIKSLGSAPACYLLLAMVSDCLDHIEAQTGLRCDGLTMSVYGSLIVAANCAAAAFFNGASNAGSNTVVISASYIWIETVAFAFCAVILRLFRIDGQKNMTASNTR